MNAQHKYIIQMYNDNTYNLEYSHVGTLRGCRIAAKKLAKETFPAWINIQSSPVITLVDANTKEVIEKFQFCDTKTHNLYL